MFLNIERLLPGTKSLLANLQRFFENLLGFFNSSSSVKISCIIVNSGSNRMVFWSQFMFSDLYGLQMKRFCFLVLLLLVVKKGKISKTSSNFWVVFAKCCFSYV